MLDNHLLWSYYEMYCDDKICYEAWQELKRGFCNDK